MKIPDSEKDKKAAQWAAFADEDLRYAEHGLTLEPETPYRLVAYHAQQCAEKYLKAFLVHHKVDFPYTHNISALLEVCEDHADWTEKLRDAEELTQFAITVRYPGADEAVEKGEAIRAIELARQVKTIVRKALSGLGMKFTE
jgi:HEPN domain-containing protein